MALTYQQALDFIFSYVDYEKQVRFSYDAETLDLSRVERLLELLGQPQNQFRSVHIAGTKGKGSTAAMTEAILRTAGYRTGLYTSPHLHTFRERIRVQGQLVSRPQLVDLVMRCGPAIKQVSTITTFEIITALALQHFAEQSIEWGVLETGLGGRLDATNVVMPEITAITTLSLDHTYLLGDTVGQIAREKAGIIKHNVPVVCAPQPPEAMEVIEAASEERAAPLIRIGEDWTWKAISAHADGQMFDVSELSEHAQGGSAVRYEGVRIPFPGQYQQLNATMAIAMVETLRRNGLSLTRQDVYDGLAKTRWPGRLETLQLEPRVLVDGAHNPDSVHKLVAALQTSFPRDRTLLIFGSSRDKDIDSMMQALLPVSDMVITTRARHPRAADPHRLAQQAAPLLRSGQTLTVSGSVAEAVELARSWARPADLICATGSLFVVGEVREALVDKLPPDDWAHEAEPIEDPR